MTWLSCLDGKWNSYAYCATRMGKWWKQRKILSTAALEPSIPGLPTRKWCLFTPKIHGYKFETCPTSKTRYFNWYWMGFGWIKAGTLLCVRFNICSRHWKFRLISQAFCWMSSRRPQPVRWKITLRCWKIFSHLNNLFLCFALILLLSYNHHTIFIYIPPLSLCFVFFNGGLKHRESFYCSNKIVENRLYLAFTLLLFMYVIMRTLLARNFDVFLTDLR